MNPFAAKPAAHEMPRLRQETEALAAEAAKQEQAESEHALAQAHEQARLRAESEQRRAVEHEKLLKPWEDIYDQLRAALTAANSNQLLVQLREATEAVEVAQRAVDEHNERKP
ncbi:MAG TPA: hypothetical protein VFC30_06620 [Solirubrobacteraceae bacterium]|nr:hypothetical protein [Solirubrobacteraceae bacterium]